MWPGPALGLGHLGNHLGPPTRERPPNFGAKIEIYIFNFFLDIGKKISFTFFLYFLRSPRELSNAIDNTTLNT